MAKQKKTKQQKVLEHLQSGKTITSWEAIMLFNATRLAAIVYCLKKQGYNIISTEIKKKDKDGDTMRFAEYKLIGQAQLPL